MQIASTRRQPNSAKSRQRVKDILRVGREVFAEKGFEAATTIEIAQRLDISEATVFSYFSGKRELCVRVIADWYDEIIEAIETGMPREAGIKHQFAFIVRTHLRLFLLQGRGLCALVLSEGRARHHEFGDALIRLQRRYTAPLMDLLARGQAAGQIRRDVPLRLLRSMVFGPMEHILWDAILAEHMVDIDSTAEQLIEMLWPSLRPPAHAHLALLEFKLQVEEAMQRLADSGAAPRKMDGES
ncbi:MAG: TetR/AcrR family transcriptional regulator [Janthinobacterium lividum]